MCVCVGVGVRGRGRDKKAFFGLVDSQPQRFRSIKFFSRIKSSQKKESFFNYISNIAFLPILKLIIASTVHNGKRRFLQDRKKSREKGIFCSRLRHCDVAFGFNIDTNSIVSCNFVNSEMKERIAYRFSRTVDVFYRNLNLHLSIKVRKFIGEKKLIHKMRLS